MYRFTESGAILRESDGACIPPDPANRDYQHVLESGAEIAPYVAPPKPPKPLAPLNVDDVLELIGHFMPPEPDLIEQERNARPDLFSNTDSPQTVSDPMGEGGEGASEPYVPDFTLIPDALARFAQADETAAEFRSRLKRLWQRFGIADGENFPGGGEPLTGEEKITMREIDIVLNSDEGKNASLLSWLLADEQRT